ncbi:acyl-CoA Delta(11) desaturase-like [Leptopilina heterotoma]|uniref:acyl-CoA Delta(11) desaturase-like n=1 Tax=Leptopilina heterotoma TaxID=63436 RepID=UPI001CA9662E|nr:acyl-CoA Delta(11) desaturase-like [Leptopilina heterotoma]
MTTTTITQYELQTVKEKKENSDIAVEDTPQLKSHDAQQPLIWRNIIGIAILHIFGVYAFATSCTQAKLGTWIFSPLYGISAGLGITAGAHRLWAHRSYSAKLPLRIFLAYLYCMAGQTHMYKWIRDHRTHHRFSETTADPHNANRGFFFSHMGWLMMKRHPDVIQNGKEIDMSDIAADPVIQFFDKFYEPIMLSLCFVLPTLIPVYCWNETWYISIHAVIIRYIWLLNATFLVNSFAHMWGNRPYNRKLRPTENPTVAFFTLGEGWHNYHHSFPWDYRAAELGAYGLNPSTAFIEIMSWFGLAYNLKTPNRDLVKSFNLNKGDGTDSFWGHQYHKNIQRKR